MTSGDATDNDSTDGDLVLGDLAAQVGEEPAAKIQERLWGYSNLPNTIKGVAKWASDPGLESLALSIIDNPSRAMTLGLVADPDLGEVSASPTQEGWGLLVLAARADPSVLDRALVDPDDSASTKLALVRKATAAHARSKAAPAKLAAAGPDVPSKVSEVKRWLAAHPEAAADLLGARKDQKASERLAAIRALGQLASPAALDALKGYASDNHSEAVLAELHRAWGRFDRQLFAAAVFRPNAYTLDLGVCDTVVGIEAVPGLDSLTVGLTGSADLAPIAACADLRTLRVRAIELPGFGSVEPLAQLTQLSELQLGGFTRGADLSVLAGLPVERLRIDLDGSAGAWLLELPRLATVLISGGATDDDVFGGGDDSLPADAGLPAVCVALADRGVDVITHGYQRSWVEPLKELALSTPGLHVVEAAGYVTVTREAERVDRWRQRMVSNVVP